MIAEKLLLHVLVVLIPILVVSLLLNDRKEKQLKVFLTVLLGISASICMFFSFEEQGMHWDLRYVLIMLAFFYAGPKAGWSICGLLLILRTVIGGDQLFVGYAVILSTSIVYYFLAKKFNRLDMKWERVMYAIKLSFYVAIIELALLTIYLELIGDLHKQYGHFIFYILVFTAAIVIAVGFATLLLEQLLEKKRIEAEMEKAAKLNAISELAASIAHEVRNPLTVVKGFLQLMQKDETGKKKEYFNIALCEMNRAEEIISDYLNFAKPQFKHVQVVEVNQIINEIFSFLSPYSLKENVALSIHSLPKQTFIHIDKNQLKQVLINIIKNAIEATPEKGEVTVEVQENETVVSVVITDNGKGMTPDQLAKIGTLFYSTKEKGTGLGTVVSFRIIQEMGGTLRYESNLDVGTKVTIMLPIAESHTARLEAASAAMK
ncbi:two-component sensor histidine kinase [Halalkalibacter wakoensis JCM 9140]|uniref:histidine kinase n=1 Tax=Halalkalibacter wakoensis JCM 9140 TaxID=1236970 RepID=W4Q325_9BACI|nr:ATP-binding protein [Halalkalibacter wakoensis]GAE26123.1 two-component sensor histidine kinase [Halalkalibacter wakoensis JCM 9140]